MTHIEIVLLLINAFLLGGAITRAVDLFFAKKSPTKSPELILEPWVQETIDVLCAELTLQTAVTKPEFVKVDLKNRQAVQYAAAKLRKESEKELNVSPGIAAMRDGFFHGENAGCSPEYILSIFDGAVRVPKT